MGDPTPGPLDALIARLRRILHDPAGATQQFSDAALTELLEAHRTDVEDTVLTAYTAHVFAASVGDWADDVVLTDGSGVELTPDAGSNIAGRWTFDDAPGTVLLSGRGYDVHAAAADAFTEWASALALQIDFTADGASYHLSQQREAMLEQARMQRAQARQMHSLWLRTDTR
jgi:hypothetical protein